MPDYLAPEEPPDCFGVVWIDHAFGQLTLSKPDAASAINTAAQMRERASDKISHCHAVCLRAGSETLVYLD
jgi:predicted metalloprotease